MSWDEATPAISAIIVSELAEMVWQIAHFVGYVDKGEEFGPANFLHFIALLCQGVSNKFWSKVKND